MIWRVIVVVLLSIIAMGDHAANSGKAPSRSDLPLRASIVKRIGNFVSYVKTAAFWVTVGHFTGDDGSPAPLMQGPIDEEWIDCEHPSDGLVAPSKDDLDEQFGEDFPLAMIIPRGEWQKWIDANHTAGFSLLMYNDTINFQAPEHSCVCNAFETAFRVVRNRQLGLAHKVKFSPMSLYGPNNARWGGSSVFGMFQVAAKTGIMPEDTPEQRAIFGDQVCHQNTPYFSAKGLPPGWADTAKHFRPLKFFRITTKEQFATALLRGWPVVNGRSGHSICHLELISHNGKFLSKYADSYGTNRGDGGYLYDSESMWRTDGAWCLRSVTNPDNPKQPTGKPLPNKTSWRNDNANDSEIDFVRLRGSDAFDAGQYRRTCQSDYSTAV